MVLEVGAEVQLTIHFFHGIWWIWVVVLPGWMLDQWWINLHGRFASGGGEERGGRGRGRGGGGAGVGAGAEAGAGAGPGVRVYVPRDAAALAVGADAVAGALQRECAARGLQVQIVRNGSRGLLWLETLVEVETPEGRVAYGPVTADAVPGLRDRLLTVNGVAKAWSMTGWRIGWGIGPAPLIAAMGAVQGQLTSGANSLAQAAALAALTGPSDLLDTRRQVLRARRDRVVAALNAMPGVDCPMPDGAFYVFPRLTLPGQPDDAALCHWLLEAHGLAIVPGRAFDLAGHARISFAYGQADLDRGLTRLAAALEGR